jgi:hypothetical protein
MADKQELRDEIERLSDENAMLRAMAEGWAPLSSTAKDLSDWFMGIGSMIFVALFVFIPSAAPGLGIDALTGNWHSGRWLWVTGGIGAGAAAMFAVLRPNSL